MYVCIFGLGYVGYPLAQVLVEKGHTVFGIDKDPAKVKKINENAMVTERAQTSKGSIQAAVQNAKFIKKADVIIICVPTPINKNHTPDLSFVIAAVQEIAAGLKKGQLIVLESTVAPGTTDDVVRPMLEKSGLKAGADFYLAHCPERIDPGNKKWTVNTIPRVVGGIDEKSTQLAYRFYVSVLDAEVMTMSSAKAAEAVKIVENTFRDVNIAFVNELAKSFDRFDIDVLEVIRGASTKPFGFMPHYPGCGVGGHCIAVDPYYLIDKAENSGFTHDFLKLARHINNSMPDYTVQKVIEGLNDVGMSVRNTKITVLGVAYKGGVDDVRESPALEIIEHLKKRGASVSIFDPYVKALSTVAALDEALDADCVVITADHPEFKKIDAKMLKHHGVKVLIDGRNILDKTAITQMGIIYKGIGR